MPVIVIPEVEVEVEVFAQSCGLKTPPIKPALIPEVVLIKLRVLGKKRGSAVGSEHSHNHNRLGSTLANRSGFSVAWHTNCISKKCAKPGAKERSGLAG